MQSKWLIAFWSITQQLNLFLDMIFRRTITRTILGKFNSRKSFNKVLRKKSTCFILQFETICLVIRHKNTCGGKLILVKVASWSTALINVIFQSNCFKAFPAITRDKQFSQIWDLYSKRANINFYVSSKINDKIS